MQENTPAKFNAIPEHIIWDLIEQCYLTERYRLVITLTDGTSICGNIYLKELSFSRKGYLGLDYIDYSVYIPLNQIAGICPLPYEQEQVTRRTDRFDRADYSDSAYTQLFNDFLKKARYKQFEIEQHDVSECIGFGGAI